ncbi:hypothetical protein OL548_02765 [Lysinibacillus sp. MHQ-1]|nr:hypothetical protein OL548_02765 [Lysinibacillus sp. MHQ-1]
MQISDFAAINWNEKSSEFGDRAIIGNANKSGVIGASMQSLSPQNGCGIFEELKEMVIQS